MHRGQQGFDVNKRLFCVLLWLSLLSGCATTFSLPPIRSDESVTVVVAMSPQADGEIRMRNLALGDNTKTGAGSGALIGALYGLACGPFAPICIPVTAGVGAVSGAVAGAAVGATGALSSEKATQLRDRFGRWRQSHDMVGELRNNVTDRARKHWPVTAEATGTVVTVELQDMQFNSTRDEQVAFVLRVLVSVRSVSTQKASEPAQKLYEYAGPLSPLAVWLDERSDFVDTSLGSALQQIATQLVSELAVH
jgi:outer membrane lipoprotein SlyB